MAAPPRGLATPGASPAGTSANHGAADCGLQVPAPVWKAVRRPFDAPFYGSSQALRDIAAAFGTPVVITDPDKAADIPSKSDIRGTKSDFTVISSRIRNKHSARRSISSSRRNGQSDIRAACSRLKSTYGGCKDAKSSHRCRASGSRKVPSGLIIGQSSRKMPKSGYRGHQSKFCDFASNLINRLGGFKKASNGCKSPQSQKMASKRPCMAGNHGLWEVMKPWQGLLHSRSIDREGRLPFPLMQPCQTLLEHTGMTASPFGVTAAPGTAHRIPRPRRGC